MVTFPFVYVAWESTRAANCLATMTLESVDLCSRPSFRIRHNMEQGAAMEVGGGGEEAETEEGAVAVVAGQAVAEQTAKEKGEVAMVVCTIQRWRIHRLHSHSLYLRSLLLRMK